MSIKSFRTFVEAITRNPMIDPIAVRNWLRNFFLKHPKQLNNPDFVDKAVSNYISNYLQGQAQAGQKRLATPQEILEIKKITQQAVQDFQELEQEKANRAAMANQEPNEEEVPIDVDYTAENPLDKRNLRHFKSADQRNILLNPNMSAEEVAEELNIPINVVKNIRRSNKVNDPAGIKSNNLMAFNKAAKGNKNLLKLDDRYKLELMDLSKSYIELSQELRLPAAHILGIRRELGKMGILLPDEIERFKQIDEQEWEKKQTGPELADPDEDIKDRQASIKQDAAQQASRNRTYGHEVAMDSMRKAWGGADDAFNQRVAQQGTEGFEDNNYEIDSVLKPSRSNTPPKKFALSSHDKTDKGKQAYYTWDEVKQKAEQLQAQRYTPEAIATELGVNIKWINKMLGTTSEKELSFFDRNKHGAAPRNWRAFKVDVQRLLNSWNNKTNQYGLEPRQPTDERGNPIDREDEEVKKFITKELNSYPKYQEKYGSPINIFWVDAALKDYSDEDVRTIDRSMNHKRRR